MDLFPQRRQAPASGQCEEESDDAAGRIPDLEGRNGVLEVGGTVSATDPHNADAWPHQRSSDLTADPPGAADRPDRQSPAAWELHRCRSDLGPLALPRWHQVRSGLPRSSRRSLFQTWPESVSTERHPPADWDQAKRYRDHDLLHHR